MDCKAVETTHNIHSALGPGTPNEGTGQQWFRKFCKGDKSLEGEEHSALPPEVDNDQLRPIIVADPLAREVAQELRVDHSMGI